MQSFTTSEQKQNHRENPGSKAASGTVWYEHNLTFKYRLPLKKVSYKSGRNELDNTSNIFHLDA